MFTESQIKYATHMLARTMRPDFNKLDSHEQMTLLAYVLGKVQTLNNHLPRQITLANFAEHEDALAAAAQEELWIKFQETFPASSLTAADFVAAQDPVVMAKVAQDMRSLALTLVKMKDHVYMIEELVNFDKLDLDAELALLLGDS